MDGIQNTNAGAVKGYYVDTPYGRFLNISDKLKQEDSSSIDMDSFVAVKKDPEQFKRVTNPEYLRIYSKNPDLLAASEEVLKQADTTIQAFLKGDLSAEELQAGYEKLANQYADVLEENDYPYPLPFVQVRAGALESFYDYFRQRLLVNAVHQNNLEGQQYITGEMNGQRTWKYYNSDYYFKSEEGIAAITQGAEEIAKEQGFEFEVPDYKAQGLNCYYNFNTAWSNQFDVSERYLIDADMVPPENFTWFYQTGGDMMKNVITPTEMHVIDPDGTETVVYYGEQTAGFDPTDPSQGTTWASYTDAEGNRQFVSSDFSFTHAESDLSLVSKYLQFSTGNREQDTLLNQFLENLQIYPKGYFLRYSSYRPLDLSI